MEEIIQHLVPDIISSLDTSICGHITFKAYDLKFEVCDALTMDGYYIKAFRPSKAYNGISEGVGSWFTDASGVMGAVEELVDHYRILDRRRVSGRLFERQY